MQEGARSTDNVCLNSASSSIDECVKGGSDPSMPVSYVDIESERRRKLSIFITFISIHLPCFAVYAGLCPGTLHYAMHAVHFVFVSRNFQLISGKLRLEV